MDDHFEVLGLTKEASGAEIRQRYLELVRAFSPERRQSGLRQSTPPIPRSATRPRAWKPSFSTSEATATRSIPS